MISPSPANFEGIFYISDCCKTPVNLDFIGKFVLLLLSDYVIFLIEVVVL